MLGFITKWIDKIAHYIEMRFRLIKLDLIQSVSGILSYFLFSFIVLFVVLALLIFLGMGMSEYFAEVLDSRAGGYFMTTGIYLLLLLLLVACRKAIANKLGGIFVGILTKSDDDDDDEKNREANPE